MPRVNPRMTHSGTPSLRITDETSGLVTGSSRGIGRMMGYVLDKSGDKIKQENPLGRFGNPEDVGGPAIYLAFPAAGYVNGRIALDGGRHPGARID